MVDLVDLVNPPKPAPRFQRQRMDSLWSDERTEILKQRWADNFTASQIANELGSITRSAVMGKVNRLGLTGRKLKKKLHPKHKKQIKKKSRLIMCGNSTIAFSHDFEFKPEPIDNVVIPISQRRTILELTRETCRWPVGDPTSKDLFFCGAPSLIRDPYCREHMAVAYQPSAIRTRKAA